MKCVLEVSPAGNDKRWPQAFSAAGLSGIAIDLSAFVNFDDLARGPLAPVKGAVPGYRWRQKVYRKIERFFQLCAMYGIRTAMKRAGKHLLKKENGAGRSSLPPADAVAAIAALHAQDGLKVDLISAPALPPEKQAEDFKVDQRLLARESIRLCAQCGCPSVAIQPLITGIPRGKEWEVNRRFFLELLPLARKSAVRLLLENCNRNFNGRIVRGPLSDPAEAARWVDSLNREAQGENFGLCLNVDAASRCRQDIREYIQHVGARLGAVRVSLGLGARFQHRELVLALRKIRFNGILACGCKWLLHGVPDCMLAPMLDVIASTLAYLRMQTELETTLRKYSSLVLFGTGLMFQNYMRNYGQLYPPLFACDNSPAKWGTEICGVSIFPPQKLLELPEDCGVFICNRYYGEMKSQLAKMGVKNIERFNDEMLAD